MLIVRPTEILKHALFLHVNSENILSLVLELLMLIVRVVEQFPTAKALVVQMMQIKFVTNVIKDITELQRKIVNILVV